MHDNTSNNAVPLTDDLMQLLDILPPLLRARLHQEQGLSSLLEVVLDLGRPAEARFPERTLRYHDMMIVQADIEYVTKHIGNFGKDNRAGIERTLHRISSILNRQGHIVGLTCRVGRAVFGTIDIMQDIAETGKNILFLGKPGVGKTTKLREIARVLADEFDKRVVIVDTSNEIAGDGDIPHPGIGGARRMQVAEPALQHSVMIEAVENHMPEAIVIDEIGTEAEAFASRTIAERGVQLIGTAHGISLENLMLNPTLADLIGGIHAVTLSDEEARKRGTQKTVLERKAPPTFDIVIELLDYDRLAIHHDVAKTVDKLLRGNPPRPEIRVRTESGRVEIVQKAEERVEPASFDTVEHHKSPEHLALPEMPSTVRIFPYGISRSRLERAIRELHVSAYITNDPSQSDAIMAIKSSYQRKPAKLREIGTKNLPTIVVKSNTFAQISNALRTIFRLADTPASAEERALREAEEGVEYVLNYLKPIELTPQNSYVRRLQHQIVEKFRLASESVGEEPNRRLRILTVSTHGGGE